MVFSAMAEKIALRLPKKPPDAKEYFREKRTAAKGSRENHRGRHNEENTPYTLSKINLLKPDLGIT
jgi:hypothetical protein